MLSCTQLAGMTCGRDKRGVNTCLWVDAASPEKPELRGVTQKDGEAIPGTIPRIKLVLLGDSVLHSLLLPLSPSIWSGLGKDHKCSALLLSQGVGKSCLVLRYVRGQFDPSSKVTVGAAFMSHSVHLPDGTTVKFEIWCFPALWEPSDLCEATPVMQGLPCHTFPFDCTGTQQDRSAMRPWLRCTTGWTSSVMGHQGFMRSDLL